MRSRVRSILGFLAVLTVAVGLYLASNDVGLVGGAVIMIGTIVGAAALLWGEAPASRLTPVAPIVFAAALGPLLIWGLVDLANDPSKRGLISVSVN